MITIFHNARCSKSREALAIVQQYAASNNMAVEVVEYLKTPPTSDQLATLQQQLADNAREIVRSNEEEYFTLGLANADNATLLRAISAHPILLQRPIIVYQGEAIVGRPPERLNAFLSEAGSR